jgi:hypothetical protein
MTHLKIKISSKYMREKPTNTLFIQFINYVWYLLHVSALHCHLHKALGTLPEYGNVMPKHVGNTIHN